MLNVLPGVYRRLRQWGRQRPSLIRTDQDYLIPFSCKLSSSYSMGLQVPATLISLGIIGGILSVASRRYLNSTPEIHFAPNPAVLSVRKDEESKEVECISIRTLLETRCRSLFTDFRPLWWLPKWVFPSSTDLTRQIVPCSGHLQTAYCVMADFSKIDSVTYDRWKKSSSMNEWSSN